MGIYDGRIKTLTIASAATESDVLICDNRTPAAIFMTAAFTGTTITIKACDTEGGTYNDVYDTAGSQLSYTVAASQVLSITPADLFGLPFIKLVSGSAEGAERSIKVALKYVATRTP